MQTAKSFQVLLSTFLMLLVLPAVVESQDLTEINDHVFYTVDEDPFSDEVGARLGVLEEDGDAAIVLQCGNTEAEIWVKSTSDYFGDEDRPVKWRFDEGEVHDGNWGINTEGDAVKVPDEFFSRFLTRMKGSSQVALRVRDYDYTQHTYIFSLQGVIEGLDQLPCPRED